MEREVGGGIGMGNTCKPMAVSFQCMTKSTTIKKKNFFPQFIVIHKVKGFGIVNKAEVDVFLELSCFFDDPMDVSNLISGSSAFSKSSLNLLNTIHVLLKPGLQNFKHYFVSV